jgi:AcrR family transcriptional regulator
MRQRAKSEEDTRQRIVDATIDLHRAVGDAGTTISAIAERAGVGRVTVYRHFPDERALLSACTSHYMGQNPPPDPSPWEALADPGERLTTALDGLYAYYRRNEDMLARAEQDSASNPILAELMQPFAEYQAAVRDLLARERQGDPLVVAAIGHAVSFGTWRSLTRSQGLDDSGAAKLMHDLVHCATNGESG